MTTGYDETLRGETAGRYDNIPDDSSTSKPHVPDNPSMTSLGTIHYGKQLAHFLPGQNAVNSFYFNGPSSDPYDHHSVLNNQIQAQVDLWSSPVRRATLDQFSNLLSTYGSTNSPGTLWALARSGLDHSNPDVQAMLTADANAYHQTWAEAAPAAGDSPQQQIADGVTPAPATTPEPADTGSIWDVPQFLSRNLMSAAMMPLEALQGSWRGVGGALTAEGGPNIGEAVASVASLLPPVAAVIDGSLLPDSEFQNPWEQTTFGQQLLDANSGAGMDAFTTNTAGLDTGKAQELLTSDPAYAEKLQEAQDNPALMPGILEEIAKTNNLRGGAGWFVDETSKIGEAQRQSTYDSWAIPGPDGAMTAWTLGRGIASFPMGPDWAGYNFVSGMIDAVASVAGDPTIWAGKLGLVGKSLRGAGVLLEKGGVGGAEMALTVGKEARKVRNGIELVNMNTSKAIRDYNTMQARKGGALIDEAEWAAMPLADQISLVRQVQEGHATQNAIKQAIPSVDSVIRGVREIRRNVSARMRGERVLAEGFPDADKAFAQQRLWQSYHSSTQGVTPPDIPKRAWEAVTEPVPAAKPRELVIEQAGEGWDVIWDGQVIGTSTSKGGAAAMRRRILAKDVEDAKFDVALASGRVTPASTGVLKYGEYTLETQGKGKWTLTDAEGKATQFTSKAAAQKAAEEAQALKDSSIKGALVFSKEQNAEWYASLSPEDRALWDESETYVVDLMNKGRLDVADPETNPEQYFTDIMNKVVSHFRIKGENAHKKVPRGKLQSHVERAAAESILDNSGVMAAGKLSANEVDYAGTVIATDRLIPEATSAAPDGLKIEYTNVHSGTYAKPGVDVSQLGPVTHVRGEITVNGKEAGHIMWDANTGVIHNIRVEPAFRRQGIATIAWNDASQYAANNGFKALEHSVTQSADAKAWIAGMGKKSGEYVPGSLQRGIHDGADVMTGWVGERPPSLISYAESVTPEVGQRLLTRMEEILKDPAHSLVAPSLKRGEKKDSLPGQVVQTLKNISDPMPELTRMFSNPGLTYGQLLARFGHLGLDGYLDDLLREEGIDGIKGVLKDRTGTWMGDHPLMEHYLFPSDATQNAETLAGIADEAARIAAAEALPRVATPVGLRHSPRAEVEGWVAQANGGYVKAVKSRTKENVRAVEAARGAQTRLERDIEAVAKNFEDPESALRSYLSHEAGIGVDNARGVTVDPQTLRWFLFGTGPTAHLRSRVLSKMAHMLSNSERAELRKLTPEEFVDNPLAQRKIAELIAITNNKWDMATYRAVLNNAIKDGGEDGLYRALAPRLGLNGVEKGSIARGVKLVEGDGMKTLQTWRQSNRLTKRWINRMTSERPGGRVVSLDNSSDVIDALIKYGMYAKVPMEEINKWIGRVALADGTFGAVTTNVDVLKKAFRQIGEVLSNRLAESNLLFQGEAGAQRLKDLQGAMRHSVDLFLGGETGEKLDFASRIGRQGDLNYFINEFGERVEFPRVQLESELLNGDIHLPSVDDWQAGMGRMAAALHRYGGVEKVYDIARSVYDNFFRTSLLVFRGAYIIRNSAEMQIRMFLNGHHTIFNDPITLIGMTLSPFTKQGRESIMNEWAKYGDTLLGDAFDAGPDKAIAFSNKVEKYFSLIREAHSLTDPRVYQSTIYKGWQRVGPTGTAFAPGWANELIMLHNSDIARVVAGNIPYDFTAQMGFSTMDDAIVSWMLSSRKDATQIRERLIGADDRFRQIFMSESMTRDYLLESPNSVRARIKQFTMDDPLLIEFVKTGVLKGGQHPVMLKKMPQLKDRVKAIRNELQTRYYEGGKLKPEVLDHFVTSNVTVPWIDASALRKGSGFVDGFFRVANNIERLGSVGPEFRMAYWDRLAQLLPGLRIEDVPRARKAALTTLSPIQRMNPNGIAGRIGDKHAAWKALDHAEKNNVSGLMTLDELHTIAMDFAADHVKELFYDAARRNNFWTATRLLFPFGQAWGNTIAQWTKLGAKQPAQVYKALKMLQGASESGSSAIYDTVQSVGGFADYSEGMAPWDQDPNGGFFYSDQYGDTSFMLPFVGRAAAVPANLLAKLNGFNANLNSVDMSSNTQSMNLALGSESIVPGTSFLVPMGLSLFPDSDIVDQLQTIAAPYGPRNAMESALPSWASNFLGGVGAIPLVGDTVADWVSPFSASVKNKNARDAVAMLSATGNYDLSDPISVRKMNDDANNLAPSFLLLSGMFKNIMPVNPTQQLSIDTSTGESTPAAKGTGSQVAFAIANNLYQQMLTEAGGDSAVAKEEFVRQYGAPFLFAVTGNKKGFSRIPSSQAMTWARQDPANMDTARAFPDYFSLFFPKGDPTDVLAKLWIEQQTNKSAENKTVEEITDESISLMIRTQRARVDWLEANKKINPNQADQWRKDIETTYERTTPGQQFNSMTTGDQLVQIMDMVKGNPSLAATDAGKAFGMAMTYRESALKTVRERSGNPATTLSGKGVKSVKEAYYTDLADLLAQYPDFQPLYNMLSKEWD